MSDVRDVLEALYNDHSDRLVKLYTNKCDGSIMDGEDIVQEGFARAYQYIDSAPTGGVEEVRDWLFKIIFNCCRDNRREARMGGAVDFEEVSELVEFNPQDRGMKYARQLIKLSDSLTRGLDPLTQRGVQLYFNNGYRYTDLARLLGSSPKYWERCIGKVRDEISRIVQRQGYFSKGKWVPVRE